MARIKDLLQDLEHYDELTEDEQKVIREMYNITKQDVVTFQNIKKTMAEITVEIGGE